MSAEIRIDPKTGYLHSGSLEITPRTTLAELSSDFSTGEEQIVSVFDKKVPCVFSTTNILTNGLEFDISLRFECRVLVSIYIAIADPSIQTATHEDFYKSRRSLRNLHEHWLTEQIGEPVAARTQLSWGVVGVAQDKSDNIYVYLHNRNNTWAFCAS